VRRFGHVPELLITFGLSYIMVELVQLVWGRSSVDYRVPQLLGGPLLTLYGAQFPLYRAFMMVVALTVLDVLWLLLRTRLGLVIRAALSHPGMAQALGLLVTPQTPGYAVLKLKINRTAPVLPYLLTVLNLIWRPDGLMGHARFHGTH
jgi:branched-subunit amino acid ABC-type transport system permease component